MKTGFGFRTSGGGTFPSPLQIFGANLVAWWDPSDASTITQSSGLVSQMNDKSGNGFNQTASGSARMTYNATAIMNSVPGLLDDGAATYMTAANLAIGTGAFAAFTLSQFPTTLAANLRLISYQANGQDQDYDNTASGVILSLDGPGVSYESSKDLTAGFTRLSNISTLVISGQPYFPGQFLRMGSVWDGSNNTVYSDTVGATPVAYTNAMGSPGTLGLGGLASGSGAFWPGIIGETVIVSGAVTSIQLAQLNQWFVRHWTRVLTVEGDSIAHSGPIYPGSPGAGGYTYLFVPNASPPVFLNNIAIGGSDLNSNGNNSDVTFRAAAYTDIRLPPNKYGQEYIFYCDGLSNNITGITDNVADAIVAFGQYLQARKTAGFDKVGCSTILSRTDAQANDVARNIFNTAMKTPLWQSTYDIDFVADFASDAIMGIDMAPTINPTYFADQVHPNAAGNIRLEPYLTASINGLP